jgi:glutamine amidotransferase PdxT
MLLSPPEPSSPSSESSLNVLARLPFLPSSLPEHAHSDVVAYSIGKKMCASFHPELSGDERFHEWFVRVLCVRD